MLSLVWLQQNQQPSCMAWSKSCPLVFRGTIYRPEKSLTCCSSSNWRSSATWGRVMVGSILSAKFNPKNSSNEASKSQFSWLNPMFYRFSWDWFPISPFLLVTSHVSAKSCQTMASTHIKSWKKASHYIYIYIYYIYNLYQYLFIIHVFSSHCPLYFSLHPLHPLRPTRRAAAQLPRSSAPRVPWSAASPAPPGWTTAADAAADAPGGMEKTLGIYINLT